MIGIILLVVYGLVSAVGLRAVVSGEFSLFGRQLSFEGSRLIGWILALTLPLDITFQAGGAMVGSNAAMVGYARLVYAFLVALAIILLFFKEHHAGALIATRRLNQVASRKEEG